MGDTQIKNHKCLDELHYETRSKTKNQIREVGQHKLKLLNMQKHKNGFGHVLPHENVHISSNLKNCKNHRANDLHMCL